MRPPRDAGILAYTNMGRPAGVAGEYELVAGFVNRSNLLKSWENTDTYAISIAGAHGPKNTAITRIPTHALPESCTHFSDCTALA